MSKTFECVICYGVNSSVKTHCSSCGTIPAQYSILGKPTKESFDDFDMSKFIEVRNAIGVDRQERHRTCKRVLRTVAADYYASND